VAVFRLDLSVATVNYKFGSLILGDLAAALDCVGLPVEDFRRALCLLALYRPSVNVRHDVLVAFPAHFNDPLSRHHCRSRTYAEHFSIPDINTACLVR
jgi:hypothetical protein